MGVLTDDICRPVQGQLDAYNARDIEGFMRWWAPDCEYYAFPNTLLARGADAVAFAGYQICAISWRRSFGSAAKTSERDASTQW